ncbi:MAG: hypothetical protein COT17_05330 [Elusimicrobia bacterium CG08_land_8_20_14_0_20_51_18]|nr:MAG: hypothetical protein COT17_05330 [Elusimicrobia bacterium CG08_land_8_20_14_0_20_51_18]
MSVKILKGSIIFNTAFDVGWEINLAKVEETLLSAEKKSSRFRFSKDPRKAIIIKEAPIKIDLPQEEITILGKKYKTSVYSRVWDYGVISINLEIPIETGSSWEELVNIAGTLETDPEIEKLSIRLKDNLKASIINHIKNPQEWDYFEDYITYFLEGLDGVSKPLELFEKADIAALILGENEHKLSTMSSLPITDNYIQYYDDDLAIIDWNSAVLIEPSGNRDVADVIEFSLTHLLELRYYDYMIDKKLDELYDIINGENKGLKRVIKTHYEKIARESSQNYVDFSDFTAKVENSLKTVGDPYVATVFRSCAEQFRFDDWYQSISRKMNTLFQITQIFQGEITAIRSHLLEIIIILLIALELIPLGWQLMDYFFPR